MALIRFLKIGSIIKLFDKSYSVGPIPSFRGLFNLTAEFFKTWARQAKYFYKRETVCKRTPPELVGDILNLIKEFLLQLRAFTEHYSFQENPFLLFYTNLYKSNIIIDFKYTILSVIDQENAIVASWELVEFIKDLLIVPPVTNGPLQYEDEADRQQLVERASYVEIVRKMEDARELDRKLSTALADWNTQNLAHAIWLYLDGKIGFYTEILKVFEQSFN